MMGSGKTTVGRLVAGQLGRRYLDNDDLVRSLSGLEPEVVWQRDGEVVLHQFEAAALEQALASAEPIVAGAAAAVVLEEPSRAALAGTDVGVVWLRARPATLSARIGTGMGRRHEATDPQWLAAAAHSRQQLYKAVADLTIDVDERPPEEVADQIAAWVTAAERAAAT
jgi:shikimate kinase